MTSRDEEPCGTSRPATTLRHIPGLVVVAMALCLRLWSLAEPSSPYWDENYYALDAYSYLGGTPELGWGDEPVKINHEWRWEHPPLAKVFIAAGVGAFGFEPIGWRIAPALFGTLSVGLLYLLGCRLWRDERWAALAAGLLALDGLHLTLSRMAMLDVFTVTFVLAASLFLVRALSEPVRGPDGGASPGDKSHLRGAGLFLGAAVATKWSAAVFLGAAAAVWVVHAFRRKARGDVMRVLTCFLGLPLLVYLASYSQFWFQHGAAVRDFAVLQERMVQRLRYGEDEDPRRPADFVPDPRYSEPASWPLPTRPISVYEEGEREVLMAGNPVLWFGFLAAVPMLFLGLVRWRRPDHVFAVAGYAVAYLPWFLVGRPKYLHYMLPAVPFMCVGVTSAIRGLGPHIGRVVAVGFAVAALAVGFALLPLWIGSATAPWTHALRELVPGWSP